MKRLLNRTEVVVNERLGSLCEEYGAHVFPKVRVADVLPIEGSGISGELFGFALQSHFDFVITNGDLDPLFAVEFDGPLHREPVQERRDKNKNSLCARFDFPLLRINARYLPVQARGIDLLSWLVESWFNARAFEDAQAEGLIPYDEPFSPAWISRSGTRSNFPYQIGAAARRWLRDLWRDGRARDMTPSNWIGHDDEGRMVAVGWFCLDDSHGVVVRTGARWGNFQFFMSELMDELVTLEVREAVEGVMNGELDPVTHQEMDERIHDWTTGLQLLSSIQSGPINPTRT